MKIFCNHINLVSKPARVKDKSERSSVAPSLPPASWLSLAPPFRQKQGEPRSLARECMHVAGKQAQGETSVQRSAAAMVSNLLIPADGDLPSRAVVDEWRRAALVAIGGEGAAPRPHAVGARALALLLRGAVAHDPGDRDDVPRDSHERDGVLEDHDGHPRRHNALAVPQNLQRQGAGVPVLVQHTHTHTHTHRERRSVNTSFARVSFPSFGRFSRALPGLLTSFTERAATDRERERER